MILKSYAFSMSLLSFSYLSVLCAIKETKLSAVCGVGCRLETRTGITLEPEAKVLS